MAQLSTRWRRTAGRGGSPLTESEEFLLGEDGIGLIVGRVDHPQTNGKIEKFFDTFERNVGNFEAIDEFMVWYNYVRPHGAFEVGKLETPGIMYYRRLPEKGRMALVDPSLLTQMEGGG